MVTSPLSLMLTMWLRQMDCVFLELGSVTSGRMPLQAARTSPRRTENQRHQRRWHSLTAEVYLIDRTTIGYAIVFMQCPVNSYIHNRSLINMIVMSALKTILFDKWPKGNMGSEIVHKTWVALLNQQTITRTSCMSPKSISLLWWHLRH